MTSQPRKKPIKLEFETRLSTVSAPDAEQVRVRGTSQEGTPHTGLSEPMPLSGTVKIRREVKGRAGKPVTVLFDFTDPNAMHTPSLKGLQATLKEKLACGGTFEPDNFCIVLQVDDLKRVRTVLEKLGFTVKG
ncbi:MAG: hypothetical protein RIR26_510 [Pseudomonadota bacterium]|jgi:translation initiation factor 1 (eIF-1/SUI1)